MSQSEVKSDPVITEIVRNGVIAITEEMKSNLMRTAYNMIIYEALDFTVQHCCPLDQSGLRFEPVPAVIGVVNEVSSKRTAYSCTSTSAATFEAPNRLCLL